MELFAGIHIQNKPNEFMPLTNIDFGKDVLYLIKEIAEKIEYDAQNIAEYPEFRRNLGTQALIRDSVLFNTLHEPSVIKNISEHYPIICGATPFIFDTIKKELTCSNSSSNFSEPATDSANSSEEENSLGATSNSGGGSSVAGGDAENALIRMISRQQLQTALQQIGLGSVNSLSIIAQRNSDTSSSTASTLAQPRTTF